MLNPTAAQSLRAFPQFTTINFDRILAAEADMACYSSEGPSDSARLGHHQRVYLAQRALGRVPKERRAHTDGAGEPHLPAIIGCPN